MTREFPFLAQIGEMCSITLFLKMGQPLASFVALAGQEEHLCLLWSQEKLLRLQEKSQEKSGKASGGMRMDSVFICLLA